MKPDIAPTPLPFSPAKQDSMLGHLLADDKLFMQARELIPAEILVDPWCSKIWDAATEFAAKWRRPPTELELRESTKLAALEPAALSKIFAKLAQVKVAMTQYGIDVLRSELDEWLQGAIYRQKIETSALHFNKGRFSEAFETIRSMSREIDHVSFTKTPEIDFSDSIGFLNQQRLDVKNALTFGVRAMDRRLLEDGDSGGLLPGDMTIMLAPTNIGKTTSMLTVGRHNIVKGKSVLLLTHEGRPADIQEKIWRGLLRVNRHDFYAMQNTQAGQARLDQAQRYLTRFLTYLPLHRPALTVEELEGIIMRAHEKRYAKYGAGYDLVINDYPAKLTTVLASKGNLQRRQKDEYVYDYLSRLASEMNFHCLAAIQGNRESSKVNRGGKGQDERLLTPEDVSESFGAMMVATNIITVNRDPRAVAGGYVTYYVGKSRSSETGWAVTCKSDYACALTHADYDDMGATWYRGTGTMSETISTLLEQYKGKPIPENLWGHY